MAEGKGSSWHLPGEVLADSLMLLLPQEAVSRAPVPEGDAKPRGEPVRGDGGGGDRAGSHSGESRQGGGLLFPPVLRPVGTTGLAHARAHARTQTRTHARTHYI